MRKTHTNQSGFTVIEVLLLILVLAVIGFGSYYVWHSQKKTSTNNTAAKTSSTAKSTSSKTPEVTPEVQYLKIPELGVELPLNSTISDLTYDTIQDRNGNATKGIVYVDSGSKLGALFTEIDPDCGNPTAKTSVYGQVLTSTAPGVNQTAKATVAVNGTTYYLYAKGGYAPCGAGSFNPTAAQQAQIDAYVSAVVSAVANAKAL